MENLTIALELVFPLCFYMALGYGLRRWLALEETTLNQINSLVYSVFLPMFLFRSIYSSNLQESVSPGVLLYGTLAIVLLFAVLVFVIPAIEPKKSNQSVMIQGIYRSNYALYGMTMTKMLYGEKNLGMAGAMATIVVPLFSLLAVLLFESFREGRVEIKTVAKNVVTNPLIVASALSLFFLALPFEIPDFVLNTVGTLGNLAAPLALLVVGAIFSMENVRRYRRQLGIVVVGKLVIVPLVFLPLGRWLGIGGVDLFVLLTVLGSPTSVSSFSMASQMGGEEELAGLIVAGTSVASVLTFFVWTFLLKQWGWV